MNNKQCVLRNLKLPSFSFSWDLEEGTFSLSNKSCEVESASFLIVSEFIFVIINNKKLINLYSLKKEIINIPKINL